MMFMMKMLMSPDHYKIQLLKKCWHKMLIMMRPHPRISIWQPKVALPRRGRKGSLVRGNIMVAKLHIRVDKLLYLYESTICYIDRGNNVSPRYRMSGQQP